MAGICATRLSELISRMSQRVEKRGVDPHTANQIISIVSNVILTGTPKGIFEGEIFEGSLLYYSDDVHIYPTYQTINGLTRKILGTLCDHTKTAAQKQNQKGRPGVKVVNTSEAEIVTATFCGETTVVPQRQDLYRYRSLEGDTYNERWAASLQTAKAADITRSVVYPDVAKRQVGTTEIENIKWSVAQGKNPTREIDDKEFYIPLTPEYTGFDPLLVTDEMKYTQDMANKIGEIYNSIVSALTPALDRYHVAHPERDVNDGKQQSSKDAINGQVHGRCENAIKAGKYLKNAAKDAKSNGPMSIRSNIASGAAGPDSAISRTSAAINAAQKMADADTPTDDKNNKREQGVLANTKALRAIYSKKSMVPNKTLTRFDKVVKSRVSKEIKQFIEEEAEDLRMLATIANSLGLDNRVTYQLGPWGMLNYMVISEGWKESDPFGVRQIQILNEEVDHMIRFCVTDNTHACPDILLRLWMVRSIMPCNMTPQVEWYCLGFPSTPVQIGARNVVCPQGTAQLFATNQVGMTTFLSKIEDHGVGIVALPRMISPRTQTHFPAGAVAVSGQGTNCTTLSPWYGVNQTAGRTAKQVVRSETSKDQTRWMTNYSTSEGRVIRPVLQQAHQPGQYDPFLFFNCSTVNPGVQLTLTFLDPQKNDIVIDLGLDRAKDLIAMTTDDDLNPFQQEMLGKVLADQVWLPPKPIINGLSIEDLDFFQEDGKKKVLMLTKTELEAYKKKNELLDTSFTLTPGTITRQRKPLLQTPTVTIDPDVAEAHPVPVKVHRANTCRMTFLPNPTWFAKGRILGGPIDKSTVQPRLESWSFDDWPKVRDEFRNAAKTKQAPTVVTTPMDYEESDRVMLPEHPGPSEPKIAPALPPLPPPIPQVNRVITSAEADQILNKYIKNFKGSRHAWFSENSENLYTSYQEYLLENPFVQYVDYLKMHDKAQKNRKQDAYNPE